MNRFKFGNIQLDPWALGNLAPRNTGVDAVIWVSTSQDFPKPFILVGNDSDSLSLVAIGNPPILLCHKSKTAIPPQFVVSTCNVDKLEFQGAATAMER